MRHLILLALTACTAWTDIETERPDTPYDGEPSGVQAPMVGGWKNPAQRKPAQTLAKPTGKAGEDAARKSGPQGMVPMGGRSPSPSLLPYGIADQDPYENDPNANRACAWAAERVATWHQRKGIEAYCKKRSWFARRGAKEPKRWVDGSYLHAIDIRAARAMWRRALKAGWIDPETCPEHDENNALRMFSRGKWFDLSLYNARHLVTTNTIPCWDPAIMDRTDVGALTVAARSAKACFKHYKSKCSEEHLRVWWREWIP